MFKVLLIRHATPVLPGVSGLDDHQRPLTTEGLRDALELSNGFKHFKLDAVYSSPYARAVQTVQPLAQASLLEVKVIDDFREHALSGTLIPNWREVLEAAWHDFDQRFPDGETMRETQKRGFRARRLAA